MVLNHYRYCFNLFHHIFQRNLCFQSLIAGCNLDNALFHIFRAYDDAKRNTEQVGIGKHYAGSDASVVVDHFDACVLQILVQLVRVCSYFLVIDADRTEVYLPRSDDAFGQIGPVLTS